MKLNKQIQQPTLIPQPPKIVPASVRYKRYKQFANRRNIATSPISTINLTENEELTFDIPKESTPPTIPKEPEKPNRSKRKKHKRKTYNFLERNTDNQRKETDPTPLQSISKTHISNDNQKQRRHHSPYGVKKINSSKSFEMPLPQVILDVEAVKNQLSQGKIELLPLMERTENDQINIQNPRGSLRFNRVKNENCNTSSSRYSTDMLNKIRENNSNIRPLIDQSKKQIFLPISSSYLDENQRLNKAKNQSSSCTSRRSQKNNK